MWPTLCVSSRERLHNQKYKVSGSQTAHKYHTYYQTCHYIDSELTYKHIRVDKNLLVFCLPTQMEDITLFLDKVFAVQKSDRKNLT